MQLIKTYIFITYCHQQMRYNLMSTNNNVIVTTISIYLD